MNINIDQLKKKIIYRSNYRGTKEMDKLLGAFTNKYINELSNEDLTNLEKLLDIDDNNLYNFYNGIKIDIIMEENKINLLFKNFKYEDHKLWRQDCDSTSGTSCPVAGFQDRCVPPLCHPSVRIVL